MCKQQPKALFLALFIKTFGKDIPTLAFEELYTDIQNNAAILDATITVKKEIPFGGRQATFYSDHEQNIHEIFIAEQVVKDALVLENNDLRGELMTMLVEEYGHYLDYLLRHHYAQTAKKDAMHDEGAKFTYKLYSINPVENADQTFAVATIDGGKPQSLIWDFREFHNDLKHYVNEERQNQDDNLGNYEFYKAGFLEPAHGKYGHGDIEKKALESLLLELADANVLRNRKQVQQILDKIYLGNWLRDFSQMADPMIVRPMNKGLEIAANVSDEAFDPNLSVGEALKPELTEKRLGEDLPEKDEEGAQTEIKITIPKLSGLKLKTSIASFSPVKISVDFVATAVALLAAREFVRDANGERKKKFDPDDDFRGYQEAFRKEYGEIDIEKLGVYRPEEHIDNPIGLGMNADGTDRGDRKVYAKFVGMIANDSSLHHINRSHGMKNYIRSNTNKHATGGGIDLDSSYGYIRKQLIKAASGGFDDTESLAHLGAALHTLEDFFAHTNYVELSLIKSVEPAVFPWVDKVTVEKSDRTFKYNLDSINKRNSLLL